MVNYTPTNLDSATDAELRELETVYSALANYCANKRTARLFGFTSEGFWNAEDARRRCRQLVLTLPDWAKW